MSQSMIDAETARRLRRARQEAGYPSASAFARQTGVKLSTYHQHENGRRDINRDAAKLYARLLNLPAGTLLYDELLHQAPRVPIVYLVTDGGVMSAAKEPLLPVILPSAAAAELIGTLVVTDQLAPVYRNGDTVFHRKLSALGFEVDPLHGLDCAVQLASGEILLAQVTVQPDHRVTLTAYGGATPKVNVRLVAGSPVEIVHRRLPRAFH